MRIDIAWSDNAIALLDNIYRFYSKKSQTAAIRLYNKLLDSAEPLRVFPQAGPIEPLGVFYDYEKIGIWQLGEEEAAAKGGFYQFHFLFLA